MVDIGFKRLKSDPCVYIYSEGGVIVTLTLHVDDVLLLGKDLKVLGRTKQKLVVSMIDNGDGSFVVEMGVTRDSAKGILTIT